MAQSTCPHCGDPLSEEELDNELCSHCGRPFDRPWADLPKAGPDMGDPSWEP